jgi:hypothetical protein
LSLLGLLLLLLGGGETSVHGGDFLFVGTRRGSVHALSGFEDHLTLLGHALRPDLWSEEKTGGQLGSAKALERSARGRAKTSGTKHTSSYGLSRFEYVLASSIESRAVSGELEAIVSDEMSTSHPSCLAMWCHAPCELICWYACRVSAKGDEEVRKARTPLSASTGHRDTLVELVEVDLAALDEWGAGDGLSSLPHELEEGLHELLGVELRGERNSENQFGRRDTTRGSCNARSFGEDEEEA